MFFLAVLLISTAASAQSDTYLCLFTDAEHTTWCGTAPSIPGPVTMYIFQLTKPEGSQCAEFRLIYPDDPDLSTLMPDYSDEINITLGELDEGISIGYDGCKVGWFLIASQMIITYSTTQFEISIVPHPVAGGPSYCGCETGFPKRDMTGWNSLYINYDPSAPECSETAVAETTWGAIKAIYAD
jgi:hypothetical protein